MFLSLQFFCTAAVGCNLTAFAWDMKRKQITVYGVPSRSPSAPDAWTCHKKVCDVLHAALVQCSSAFFEGWLLEQDGWTHLFIDSGVKRSFPSSESQQW